MDIVTIPNNKPTCKWQNHHYRVRQIKHENARFLSAFCAWKKNKKNKERANMGDGCEDDGGTNGDGESRSSER